MVSSWPPITHGRTSHMSFARYTAGLFKSVMRLFQRAMKHRPWHTMLDQITPLILTHNEAPNIGRTLAELSWASDIVVVDSFSDDETLEIVSRFPQVRVYQRQFDSHENQWNFGLRETGIDSEWLLA